MRKLLLFLFVLVQLVVLPSGGSPSEYVIQGIVSVRTGASALGLAYGAGDGTGTGGATIAGMIVEKGSDFDIVLTREVWEAARGRLYIGQLSNAVGHIVCVTQELPCDQADSVAVVAPASMRMRRGKTGVGVASYLVRTHRTELFNSANSHSKIVFNPGRAYVIDELSSYYGRSPVLNYEDNVSGAVVDVGQGAADVLLNFGVTQNQRSGGQWKNEVDSAWIAGSGNVSGTYIGDVLVVVYGIS